jgi:hypothetical protein
MAEEAPQYGWAPELFQRVWIPELSTRGVVMAVHEDGAGKSYKVRYFFNGDERMVYFFSWELEAPRS